jgi:ribulose kinase
MPIAPNPPRHPSADYSETMALQRRLSEAADEMAAITDDVGRSRQIREFSSDQRKRALGRAMQAALAGGESTSKAEAEARASEPYGKELAQLAKELTAAEQTLARWDVLRIKWESARSLLSVQKSQMQMM